MVLCHVKKSEDAATKTIAVVFGYHTKTNRCRAAAERDNGRRDENRECKAGLKRREYHVRPRRRLRRSKHGVLPPRADMPSGLHYWDACLRRPMTSHASTMR